MRPVVIVDAASLYVRSFHGVPRSVRSPDGRPVNAVRGYLDALAHLVARLDAGGLVSCRDDDWRPAFRVAALPSYKAHRARPDGTEEMPPELGPQVPVIEEVLAALGVASAGAPGFEADDVAATAARAAAAAGRPAVVVSGDRDLLQLVDDAAGVRVLYAGRGLRAAELVDGARLLQLHGVADGAGYRDLSVLRGDPSDGLPGVPGVGARTAAALLAAHGDLAGVLAAAAVPGPGGPSPTVRRRLAEAAGYLAAAPGVVGCVTDVPLPGLDPRLPAAPADPGLLADLAARHGLDGPVRRLSGALAAAAAAC